MLYAGNKSAPKKLVIVFEDSRYSTDTALCNSLTTEWPQRFGIRNCREGASIFFCLCSVGEDRQREEGVAESSVSDIVSCTKKPYRTYFFVNDLAVGYLEFAFDHEEINGRKSGWRREVERNSVSLPQIKKDPMPAGLVRKNSGAVETRGNSKSNNVLGEGFKLKRKASIAGGAGVPQRVRRRSTTHLGEAGLGRLQ